LVFQYVAQMSFHLYSSVNCGWSLNVFLLSFKVSVDNLEDLLALTS